MNKRWIARGNKYILIFTPCSCSDEEVLAEVFYEEDGGWCYNSSLLDATAEYLGSDTLEDVKRDIENIIENYLEEEIDYYQVMYARFTN